MKEVVLWDNFKLFANFTCPVCNAVVPLHLKIGKSDPPNQRHGLEIRDGKVHINGSIDNRGRGCHYLKIENGVIIQI